MRSVMWHAVSVALMGLLVVLTCLTAVAVVMTCVGLDKLFAAGVAASPLDAQVTVVAFVVSLLSILLAGIVCLAEIAADNRAGD